MGLPQLTEPVVDTEYMRSRMADDRDNKQVNKKITEEEDSSRYESEERAADDDDRANCHTAGVVCSLAHAEPGCLNLEARRYDKRKRMRALVMGAVNDPRTMILLDTGANVSVISASYAKKLHLREVPDHDRNLEVRGINPGTLETRRRALVKITLG
ncbi:Eukaryotic/viral aspartic protease [Phytophthora megakarya]|uniref:Eukaryotic/viral aspartic protease n=1 Tax=Phytophthora megakarya TaxID=4795 RepID=A0A225WL93_9STRA|nr:Eukaryotic/viral aspartic protease [Phytophthora megakarya]